MKRDGRGMRKLRGSGLCFTASLLLMVATMAIAGRWDKGENRINNSDFEADSVANPPMDWAIQKGG